MKCGILAISAGYQITLIMIRFLRRYKSKKRLSLLESLLINIHIKVNPSIVL